MMPRKLIGKVESKTNLVGDNWLIKLSFEEKLKFLPGQYASIKVNEAGHRRSYSISSLPGDKVIDILVDVSPMGMGSRYMLGIKAGDAVEMLGFLGRFVVDQEVLDSDKDLLFVATGTGIAPFKPMIEDLLENKNFKRNIRLIWGMRYEKDLYWIEELESLKNKFVNFNVDITLSQPSENWQGNKGRVGVVVDKIENNWSETVVYLCGSTEMVEMMRDTMEYKGVFKDNIFYEKFF